MLDPPEQAYPVSIAHALEQPSPEALLASSHASVPILFPSPHIGEHVSAVADVAPAQVYPVSVAHTELHPSPFTLFPSSQ